MKFATCMSFMIFIFVTGCGADSFTMKTSGKGLRYGYIESKTPSDITVIFESGTQTDSFLLPDGAAVSWNGIIPNIEGANLLVYNRAGLGGSKSSGRPSRPRDVAHGLIELLIELRIRPPYVFVGHSMGGYFAEYFARRYPEYVNGLVLLDPSPIDYARTCQKAIEKHVGDNNKGGPVSAEHKREIEKICNPMTDPRNDSVLKGAYKAEIANWTLTPEEMFGNHPPFPGPVSVISADRAPALPEFMWRTVMGDIPEPSPAMLSWMQTDHRARSNPPGRHLIVESGHLIPLTKPKEVVQAIHEMIRR